MPVYHKVNCPCNLVKMILLSRSRQPTVEHPAQHVISPRVSHRQILVHRILRTFLRNLALEIHQPCRIILKLPQRSCLVFLLDYNLFPFGTGLDGPLIILVGAICFAQLGWSRPKTEIGQQVMNMVIVHARSGIEMTWNASWLCCRSWLTSSIDSCVIPLTWKPPSVSNVRAMLMTASRMIVKSQARKETVRTAGGRTLLLLEQVRASPAGDRRLNGYHRKGGRRVLTHGDV